MICKNPACAKEFTPKRPWSTYCNKACRFTHYNQTTRKVGKDIQVVLGSPARIPDGPAALVVLLTHNCLLWWAL